MRKTISFLSLMLLILSLFSCSKKETIKVWKTGGVTNKSDFNVIEYNPDDKESQFLSQSTNSYLSVNTLEEYENILSRFENTGEKAIIKCRKVGISENYILDNYLNGNKIKEYTGFTLTQVEVLDVYDGVKITKSDNSLNRGDIITVYEDHYLYKDSKMIFPDYFERTPIYENTNYIIYLSKVKDGYKYYNAVLNNVWATGSSKFVINNETKKIKTKEDVNKLAKSNPKLYIDAYVVLYPQVVEKYFK